MSPLTKLFVVLLVLLSIILTAGVVTFVNRLEPMNQQLLQAKADANARATLLATRTTELSALQAQFAAAVTEAAKAAGDAEKAIRAIQIQKDASDTSLSQANNQIAVLTSANASATAAVQASEEAKVKLQEQVVALRKDTDERLRQIVDLGQRVNKLVAELSKTEEERRNLAEQFTELQGKNDQAMRMLKDLGVTPQQVAAGPTGVGRGAPAINGVIRSRENIAGREYAKISIGSQDQVIKGMQFQIIDKESGAFLGVLTVDVVDANEAMGHITADQGKLAQIRAGAVVKTQI